MTRRPLLLLVVVGPSDNEDRNDDEEEEEESSIADMAPMMIQIDPACVMMSWISFASMANGVVVVGIIFWIHPLSRAPFIHD